MSYDRGTRTEFASKAMQLSALFEMKFRKTRFAGSVEREVKVSEQMGESSGGGKMARESIMLAPTDGSQKESIVVGWMDVGNSVAEIRSYNTIASRYEQRFHSALELPREEYKAFIDEVAAFFQQEGIQTTVVDSPPPSGKTSGPPATSTRASGNNTMIFVAIGAMFVVLVGVLGLAALWFFVLRGA